LERKSDPICLARAAVQPLILGQKRRRKAAMPASLSRKSDAKVTQKCATCRIRLSIRVVEAGDCRDGDGLIPAALPAGRPYEATLTGHYPFDG
jgi:hypothetical protein